MCVTPGISFPPPWDDRTGVALTSGGNIPKTLRGGAPGGAQRVKLEDASLRCKHYITRWSRVSQDADLNIY